MIALVFVLVHMEDIFQDNAIYSWAHGITGFVVSKYHSIEMYSVHKTIILKKNKP